MAEPASAPRAVQAVGLAASILDALAREGRPVALGRLAAALDLAPPKLHRYVAALVEAGLVAQRPSGLYDLGGAAARIGLAALGRVDPVSGAMDAVPALADETGHTVSLSVWGDRGPIIVRWEAGAAFLVTSLGLGSALSPTRSATGLAMLAHMPDRRVSSVAGEVDAAALARVRDAGVAVADGTFIPGLVAVAAPVLDAQGTAAAALTVIGTDPALLAADAPARAALRTACDALGRAAGRPETDGGEADRPSSS